MIQFECPSCGKQLLVKNSREDSVIKCPGCKERFELDLTEEDEGPVDDYEVIDEEEPTASPPADEAPPRGAKKVKDGGKALKTKKKKGKRKKKGASVVPPPRVAATFMVLGLLAMVIGGSYLLYRFFATSEPSQKYTPKEAVTMILGWRGKLEYDIKLPGTLPEQVVGVSYMGMSGSFKYEYLEPLLSFKNLRRLTLTNTKTGDLGADHIKDLTSLTMLNLSSTNITDAGIRELKTLVNLEELHLDNTLVSDNGLAALTGLKKLKRISLSGSMAHGHELKAAIPGLLVEKN